MELAADFRIGKSGRISCGINGALTIFPTVSVEIFSTGPADTGALLKEGRADLGLMIEQESYPSGFQFRGVGHSTIVPVCAPEHPLAGCLNPGYADLRQYRQIILHSQYHRPDDLTEEIKSPTIWHAESPEMIAALVMRGLGWAELPLPSVSHHLAEGSLMRMACAFQQSDAHKGIDVIWTERRALGRAGQWFRDQLLAVPQADWCGE
ncbi:substrate-binding domain-containing protein [Antarctobacter heliothermus]|uniref:LysR substrate binding domain-containing protein n=1 Tax=Antarctobacter heliothermus TaxID=74033 RepID=A0A239KG66_9RHOB|nr:substrate-binding domain-containing protein [Antarctobacter heliothermus]SNT16633.1 LysR substrate binding domain-containing protein [Antarctobacter heliothermus]